MIENLNIAPAQSLRQNDALEVLKAADSLQFGQRCLIGPSRPQPKDSTRQGNGHLPQRTVQLRAGTIDTNRESKGVPPIRHSEPLQFTAVQPSTQSYK